MSSSTSAPTSVTTLALCNQFDRTICYEPHPVTSLILQANVTRSTKRSAITTRQLALGDTTGQIGLRDIDPENAGSARIASGETSSDFLIDVTTADLDLSLILKEGERIDLVKIDVEGFEPNVIRGMQAHLRQHQPVVVFESSDAPSYQAIHPELSDLGYRSFHAFSDNQTSNRLLRFLRKMVFGYELRLTALTTTPDHFVSMAIALPQRLVSLP
ncbi:MAG: FkbM family methyltransferase [Ahniella sp.]|nr:FkbM family methyltransferase [Ahniella sp.]